MTRQAFVSAAMLLAFPAAAQVPPEAGAESAPAAEAQQSAAQDQTDFDLAKKKVVECEGEKFIFAWGAGAHPTKVTLCSDKGATPEQIATMLEDAASQLAKTASIAEDRRMALVQQIRAKAEEVRMRPTETKPVAVAETAPSSPQPVVSAPPQFSALPPLPAPTTQAPTAVANRPPVAPPRLGFECITPGEFASGGPCVTLTRDTIVVVQSRDALPDQIALRFFRDGATRGEVTFGAMRKGQSRRLRIPMQVCSGVSTGEVAIRVVRAGQVVGTEGPYLLRC
jgi:hypothetical protein